ncbi:hypothetical protein WAI453_012536 [Rhynchosporium graminicola]
MASSSASTMLQPVPLGGYGRNTGLYGGLEGLEYASCVPPDVQKNSRIIAVCGIPQERASPQTDGWFFSDFFLFWQMFNAHPDLPHQKWFSCCSPKRLAQEHKDTSTDLRRGMPRIEE